MEEGTKERKGKKKRKLKRGNRWRRKGRKTGSSTTVGSERESAGGWTNERTTAGRVKGGKNDSKARSVCNIPN